MAEISIRPMNRTEFPDVLELLRHCDLPLDGLAEHRELIVVAHHQKRIVGCAAVERYGTDGLLRSVAVDNAFRRLGLGQELLDTMLHVAQQAGVSSLFLLTETASDYFGRRGFTIIDRSSVPELVRQSVEFASACPASALAMSLTISKTDSSHV